MDALYKATCGNAPTMIKANAIVTARFVAKALRICREYKLDNVSFQQPGDMFGIEVIPAQINYSECYDWRLNVRPVPDKSILEFYYTWVVEHRGVAMLGTTAVQTVTMASVDSKLY